MSLEDDLVAQMREFIARRHAGEVISQSNFQRRSRWCWIKSF